MRRTAITALLLGVAAATAVPPAHAAVRAGEQADPADAPAVADVAAAALRHDDASGALTLTLRLHAPLGPDAELPRATWSLAERLGAAGCEPAPAPVSTEHTLTPGQALIGVARPDGDEELVTGQVTVSADRREVRLDATDARLAGRVLACARVELSNGEAVPAFGATETTTAPAPTAPAPAPAPAPGPGTATGTGTDADGTGTGTGDADGTGTGTGATEDRDPVRRLRLRITGRRRQVLDARVLVCAPAGRVRLVADETRVRLDRGGPRGTVRTTRRFTRTQRRRCQEHRLRWRLPGGAEARHRVRVRVRIAT
jgi:hypothetical protein